MRILRVISRLNIGGPAIQAITLTQRLEEHGYRTTLVRGTEEPDEGSMDDLAQQLGVRPLRVPALRRNPGLHDLRALGALVRIMRRERPQIVHTHAAKAGTIGRAAALIAFPRPSRRPVLIHTYHGHSLTGYFSPRVTAVYRMIERVLGGFSDRLIAVSEEVRDELVALGVAPASKFEVVRLGFDLSPFMVKGEDRARMREALRTELGIPLDAHVATLVARLVPIKRVDRFLRIALALSDLSDVRFLIVGDGELRQTLQNSAEARALDERVVWAGFRRDMPAVYFASDVVAQTSDNEGTPVALIEAQAAGVPVVSTAVGGTASVVSSGSRAWLFAPEDELEVASAIRMLYSCPELSRELSVSGQEHASSFDLGVLLARLTGLYSRLLARQCPTQ
ncbi:MAG TPA: glycosyltransferase [Solirubrobacteraceae bacterium]|nr:glycosyltransferase [Solirubrobacteraceae bacterium]